MLFLKEFSEKVYFKKSVDDKQVAQRATMLTCEPLYKGQLGRIWPNFKLIQALMYVIITCKYEKDPIKNNREKVAIPFSKL